MSRTAVANAWLKGYQPPSARATEMARLYVEEELTLQEIADRYNLSRERVRQLLVPFGVTSHRASCRCAVCTAKRERDSREKELREVHDAIISGKTTTAAEAERMGYAKPAYLRMAMWRIGLKLRKPAMGTAERKKAARDQYFDRVRRGPKKHGTVSSYKNFGCRCPKCKAANRKHERERKSAERRNRT